MAGFNGFINNSKFNIKKMVNFTLYSPKLVVSDNFADDYITVANIKLNYSENQSIQNENCLIIVNGRCFNSEKIKQVFNITGNTFEEILYQAYDNKILDKVLNKINGHFQAFIYDKILKKVFLISDRRGTHYIYYYKKENDFVFASEVKSILNLKNIDTTINQNSFDYFMDLGFLTEENTWFENIKLIKPSSIIEYDIKTSGFKEYYYWKYSEIPQQNLTFEESVAKLAELLPKAVRRMYNPNDEIMVLLSAGYDSRMIASSFEKLSSKINLNFSTFGQKGCDDAKIAKQIAKKLKQKHSLYSLNNDDVVKDRANALWQIDGHCSIQHAHGLNLLNNYPPNIKTIFSGVAGGEIYGCTHFIPNTQLDKIPTNKAYEKFLKKHSNNLIVSDYYQTPHFYPIVIDNLIRRFSFSVQQVVSSHFNIVFPFLDNDLLDFMNSVPDSYKLNYKLYYTALKKAFPYFYTKIPFQKYNEYNPEPRFRKLKREFLEKIKKALKIKTSNYFYDYKAYIEDSNNQKEFKRILETPNKFLNDNNARFIENYYLKNWDNIKHNPDLVLKLVSVKLYFDKVSEVLNDTI